MAEIEVNKTSVCEVTDTYYQGLMLTRLFDIEEDMLVRPELHDGPRKFGNRKRLYKNDGPNDVGTVGVWNWTAIPNNNDPDKDYVTSKYQSQIKLIYAMILHGVSTHNQLINMLKRGIDVGLNDVTYTNLLVLYRNEVKEYEGVYCPAGALSERSHSAFLNSTVTLLETVIIDADDLLWIERNAIYRFLDIDPVGTILTAPIHDIVKQVVMDRTTWRAFSNFVGGTHSELNLFKAFLESITERAPQIVAEKTGLDEETASDYVDDFILHANSYMENADIDSEMLSGLLETNTEIRERFGLLAQERWEKEHKQQLEKKEAQIIDAKETLEELQSSVGEQQQLFKKTKVDFQNWLQEAARTRTAFEASMQSRIDDLQNNLGSTLADSIYFRQLCSPSPQIEGPIPSINYVEGVVVETEETASDYLDVHDLLIDNLGIAGIKESYRKYLSSFLLSCLKEKNSVILAGPNGKAIADAVSVTLYSKTAGHINCNKDNQAAVLHVITHAKDPIICVDQFCKYGFVDELPSLLATIDKPFFLLTPFAEDLTIEPAGLYNYALPLMTEIFVTARPTTEWIGGLADAEWLDFEIGEEREKFVMINPLVKSELARNSYRNVLKLSSHIVDEYARDGLLSYICAYIPYAYVTGRTCADLEDSESNVSISQEVKDLMIRYLGE